MLTWTTWVPALFTHLRLILPVLICLSIAPRVFFGLVARALTALTWITIWPRERRTRQRVAQHWVRIWNRPGRWGIIVLVVMVVSFPLLRLVVLFLSYMGLGLLRMEVVISFLCLFSCLLFLLFDVLLKLLLLLVEVWDFLSLSFLTLIHQTFLEFFFCSCNRCRPIWLLKFLCHLFILAWNIFASYFFYFCFMNMRSLVLKIFITWCHLESLTPLCTIYFVKFMICLSMDNDSCARFLLQMLSGTRLVHQRSRVVVKFGDRLVRRVNDFFRWQFHRVYHLNVRFI